MQFSFVYSDICVWSWNGRTWCGLNGRDYCLHTMLHEIHNRNIVYRLIIALIAYLWRYTLVEMHRKMPCQLVECLFSHWHFVFFVLPVRKLVPSCFTWHFQHCFQRKQCKSQMNLPLVAFVSAALQLRLLLIESLRFTGQRQAEFVVFQQCLSPSWKGCSGRHDRRFGIAM